MYIRRSPRCMQCIFQLIFAHICASIRIYGDILLMVTYSYGDILVWWHTRMLTYSSSELVLCDNILVMVTHSYTHTCAARMYAHIIICPNVRIYGDILVGCRMQVLYSRNLPCEIWGGDRDHWDPAGKGTSLRCRWHLQCWIFSKRSVSLNSSSLDLENGSKNTDLRE